LAGRSTQIRTVLLSSDSGLDRDVLVQTGAEYLIVLEGNADFLIPPLIGSPAEVVTVKQVRKRVG
jgi:hypothetical protein